MAIHQSSRDKLRVDHQSLALHEVIANKIAQQPALLDVGRARLEERYASGLIRYGTYMQWDSILRLYNHEDPTLFKDTLLAKDPCTMGLRRQTIFTGILTEEERAKILDTLD